MQQVSAPFDLEAVMKSKASDPSALHVVLLQEVERYNSLLVRVRSSCSQVQAGLKGLVVMSADLDEIADALYNAKVQLLFAATHMQDCGLILCTRSGSLPVGQLPAGLRMMTHAAAIVAACL